MRRLPDDLSHIACFPYRAEAQHSETGFPPAPRRRSAAVDGAVYRPAPSRLSTRIFKKLSHAIAVPECRAESSSRRTGSSAVLAPSRAPADPSCPPIPLRSPPEPRLAEGVPAPLHDSPAAVKFAPHSGPKRQCRKPAASRPDPGSGVDIPALLTAMFRRSPAADPARNEAARAPNRERRTRIDSPAPAGHGG